MHKRHYNVLCVCLQFFYEEEHLLTKVYSGGSDSQPIVSQLSKKVKPLNLLYILAHQCVSEKDLFFSNFDLCFFLIFFYIEGIVCIIPFLFFILGDFETERSFGTDVINADFVSIFTRKKKHLHAVTDNC